MKLSAHPFWLVGFRPFFFLACISGLALPVLWALVYSGVIELFPGAFSRVQWHAHEMFFGFGWAVLGGFLLTSTKNWTKVRGYHGNALVFLFVAWVCERLGMWFQGALPHYVFLLSNNIFLLSIILMLCWTLIKNRKEDAYRDNYFFVLILPVFMLAKYLMLDAEFYQTGWSIALGLFRIAFLVMLVRTLGQFMKSAYNVTILQNPALNQAIILLGLLLVFESLMPAPLAGVLALLLAVLLGARFIYWKPQLALRRIDIGVMYLGYMAIVAQLVFEFIRHTQHPEWNISTSMHIFTFGAMGLIIPGMVVRIAKGHTGRKVAFETMDKLAIGIMLLAFLLRIVAPQLYPAAYVYWIYLAASCWFASFGLLGWRYIPMLLRPRVDGKVH